MINRKKLGKLSWASRSKDKTKEQIHEEMSALAKKSVAKRFGGKSRKEISKIMQRVSKFNK